MVPVSEHDRLPFKGNLDTGNFAHTMDESNANIDEEMSRTPRDATSERALLEGVPQVWLSVCYVVSELSTMGNAHQAKCMVLL